LNLTVPERDPSVGQSIRREREGRGGRGETGGLSSNSKLAEARSVRVWDLWVNSVRRGKGQKGRRKADPDAAHVREVHSSSKIEVCEH
jgi:hypothetical protein